MIPPRLLSSYRDLPMFFDDAHVALGEQIAQSVKDDDKLLHDSAKAGARMAELGLFELLVPKELGGKSLVEKGIGVRGLCIAREQLGYVSPLADSIFAVQGLGSYPLVLAADVSDRASFFKEVGAGARIGAFALTEPEAGSDVGAMRTVAKAEGDHWVIDGEKVFISNATIAHHFVVFANAAPELGKKGISAFLVPKGVTGLTIETMSLSVDHPLGRVLLKGVRVPKNALLGEVGHGLRFALGTLDVFRTSVGAAACGMARRAIDETIARVSTRKQFGKPLSDFQLTQAALADMVAELDAARLLVMRAAWMKDRGERAAREVAIAKMTATESAQRIIDRAVQLHGGLGVLAGSVVEALYREIRPLRIYEGTTEIQKMIIGSSLFPTA